MHFCDLRSFQPSRSVGWIALAVALALGTAAPSSAQSLPPIQLEFFSAADVATGGNFEDLTPLTGALVLEPVILWAEFNFGPGEGHTMNVVIDLCTPWADFVTPLSDQTVTPLPADPACVDAYGRQGHSVRVTSLDLLDGFSSAAGSARLQLQSGFAVVDDGTLWAPTATLVLDGGVIVDSATASLTLHTAPTPGTTLEVIGSSAAVGPPGGGTTPGVDVTLRTNPRAFTSASATGSHYLDGSTTLTYAIPGGCFYRPGSLQRVGDNLGVWDDADPYSGLPEYEAANLNDPYILDEGAQTVTVENLWANGGDPMAADFDFTAWCPLPDDPEDTEVVFSSCLSWSGTVACDDEPLDLGAVNLRFQKASYCADFSNIPRPLGVGHPTIPAASEDYYQYCYSVPGAERSMVNIMLAAYAIGQPFFVLPSGRFQGETVVVDRLHPHERLVELFNTQIRPTPGGPFGVGDLTHWQVSFHTDPACDIDSTGWDTSTIDASNRDSVRCLRWRYEDPDDGTLDAPENGYQFRYAVRLEEPDPTVIDEDCEQVIHDTTAQVRHANMEQLNAVNISSDVGAIDAAWTWWNTDRTTNHVKDVRDPEVPGLPVFQVDETFSYRFYNRLANSLGTLTHEQFAADGSESVLVVRDDFPPEVRLETADPTDLLADAVVFTHHPRDASGAPLPGVTCEGTGTDGLQGFECRFPPMPGYYVDPDTLELKDNYWDFRIEVRVVAGAPEQIVENTSSSWYESSCGPDTAANPRPENSHGSSNQRYRTGGLVVARVSKQLSGGLDSVAPGSTQYWEVDFSLDQGTAGTTNTLLVDALRVPDPADTHCAGPVELQGPATVFELSPSTTGGPEPTLDPLAPGIAEVQYTQSPDPGDPGAVWIAEAMLPPGYDFTAVTSVRVLLTSATGSAAYSPLDPAIRLVLPIEVPNAPGQYVCNSVELFADQLVGGTGAAAEALIASDLLVQKKAMMYGPPFVNEDGDWVQFWTWVKNISDEDLWLISRHDDTLGVNHPDATDGNLALNPNGTVNQSCEIPADVDAPSGIGVLLPPMSPTSPPCDLDPTGCAECIFHMWVGGNAGDTHANIVTAVAEGLDGTLHIGQAPEQIAVVGILPQATVEIEGPDSAVAGSDQSFTVTVTNWGREDFTLLGLADDSGPLGTCTGMPDLLESPHGPPDAGASDPGIYVCTFDRVLIGTAGTAFLETVTATYEDDEGNPVMTSAEHPVDLVSAPSPPGGGPSCGLGFELALFTPLYQWFARRRSRLGAG